jgi:hypothetical protein
VLRNHDSPYEYEERLAETMIHHTSTKKRVDEVLLFSNAGKNARYMDEETWRQELFFFQRHFGAQDPCNTTEKGIGKGLELRRMDCIMELVWLLLCFTTNQTQMGLLQHYSQRALRIMD